MSVPAVRRVVVGVDGSVESVAALRWACREASLRGAEVHAVYVREEHCHSLPSYAVSALSAAEDPTAENAENLAIDVADFVRSVKAGQAPGVAVHVEEVHGLPARVLLDRCAGADMLVLGTASDVPGALRSAGPVIRACLRRAPCPVVVIGAAQDPMQRREPAVSAAQAADEERVKVPAGV